MNAHGMSSQRQARAQRLRVALPIVVVVGLSAVAALLNMVWAGSALVGPILAGGISQAASPEASYLVVIVMALAGSAWMATAGRAPRVAREPDCTRTVTGR